MCLKKYIQAAHRMSVAVCSMLIAGGLVAAVSSGSSVHEPETHENTQLNNRGRTIHKCAASYNQTHRSESEGKEVLYIFSAV